MNFLSAYFKYENGLSVNGLTKELNVFYVLELLKKINKNIVILTNTLFEANTYFDLLSTYENKINLFPMDDFLTSVAVAISPDLKIKRLETLENLQKEQKSITVTNLMGFLRYLPDKNNSLNLNYKINKNKTIKRDEILDILEKYGYVRESLVTMTGEYAVRGYIIDLFIIDEEHPIRIEFFGDEVDSIRYFDESTQLSINEIEEITIKPYTEITGAETSSLIDYANNPLVIMINKDQIDLGYEKILSDIYEYKISQNIDNNKSFMYMLEDIKINDIMYFNSLDSVSILFFLNNENQLRSLEPFLDSYHVVVNDKIIERDINIIYKKINNGFVFDKYVVIAANDIEKVKNSVINYKNSYKIGKKIKDFGQLNIGDYVVHSQHGIGIYQGVITLTKNGLKKDYIQINYQGNDKIYIPVEKITTIFKYAGKEVSTPKLDKLNSTNWAKKKR